MKILILCFFLVGCGLDNWIDDQAAGITPFTQSIEENTEFSNDEMKMGRTVCNLLVDGNRLKRLDLISQRQKYFEFSVERKACNPRFNIRKINKVRAKINTNYTLSSRHSRANLLVKPFLLANDETLGRFCIDFINQKEELERTFDLRSKFLSLHLEKLNNGKIKLTAKEREANAERGIWKVYIIETNGSMKGEVMNLSLKRPCVDDSSKFEETFQVLTDFPRL